MKKHLLLVLTFLTITTLSAYSQNFYSLRKDRKFSAVFGLGSAIYFGDLYDPIDGFQSRYGLNIGAKYRANERVNLRGNLFFYNIAGDDAKAAPQSLRQPRNLNFTSNNMEITGMVEINLLPTNRGFIDRAVVNPYLLLGAGITTVNPTTVIEGERIKLRDVETEGVRYGPIAIVLPVGLGVKYKASPYMDVFAEAVYRFTTTDYLDDVSAYDYSFITDFLDDTERVSVSYRWIGPQYYEDGTYQGPGQGFPDLENINERRRGNPESKDGYLAITFGVEIFIPQGFFSGGVWGSKYKGPKFR
ncbi:outer membrane beta-barrel protein [Penaeicola halotolerans]|uniref:outer membrane beta-barrel protein n=1 Tax=Penaeicola halotolerans TaxID=2793196 RepID=UPI001CF8A2E9|nr:outer membrane beta-barrel protein [Penaeicola halotolerans]